VPNSPRVISRPNAVPAERRKDFTMGEPSTFSTRLGSSFSRRAGGGGASTGAGGGGASAIFAVSFS
jgi:hypothetical protein